MHSMSIFVASHIFALNESALMFGSDYKNTAFWFDLSYRWCRITYMNIRETGSFAYSLPLLSICLCSALQVNCTGNVLWAIFENKRLKKRRKSGRDWEIERLRDLGIERL